MDSEILKPKDLTDTIFFKEDTLDLIFKVISSSPEIIKIKVIFNNSEYKDDTGSEHELDIDSFKNLVQNNKFIELTSEHVNIFKNKKSFLKEVNKLKPKNKQFMASLSDDEKKWEVKPNPGTWLQRYSNNEDAIRRLMTFMELDHVQIRNILIDILDEKYYDVLAKGDCKKEYSNDRPKEVTFSNYDSIIINWTGIYHRPEHGEQINLFSGFVIDAILNNFSDLDLWENDK
jgi:hypothetical protein